MTTRKHALPLIDYPPGSAESEIRAGALTPVSPEAATASQILRSPRFWAFAIAAAIVITGIVVLNAHIIPMVGMWRISATAGATLVSVCALAGIPGLVAPMPFLARRRRAPAPA